MTHVHKPERRILTNEDLEKWKNSETFELYVNFISKLSDSVKGKTNDFECEVSEPVKAVLHILDQVEALIEQFPVVKDKEISRFGKVEFRSFYDAITAQSETMIQENAASAVAHDAGLVDELCVYFNESWGNRTRIDYGSGHELNFMCFLLCLTQLKFLNLERDAQAIVLKIFIRYLSIMRKLQKTYWLEPAGSHGVWGLDDYHFLPFLFGASQLSTHPHLKPKSIHNMEYVEMFKDKYMYFNCIWFINQIKTASLRWHSPMLDDISAVKTWAKIAEGMIKMYKAEVLNKLPIIQHFFFGSILQAPQGVSEPAHVHDTKDPDSDEGLHDHSHTWGDCCGIKIPSAIAAHELNEKTVKPIPFD